jgi:hypothetical protein
VSAPEPPNFFLSFLSISFINLVGAPGRAKKFHSVCVFVRERAREFHSFFRITRDLTIVAKLSPAIQHPAAPRPEYISCCGEAKKVMTFTPEMQIYRRPIRSGKFDRPINLIEAFLMRRQCKMQFFILRPRST